MAIALSIAYAPTPLAAGAKLAIYATKPLSQGISRPSAKAYALLSVSAAAAASPANILAAYTAKYGALVSGQKIFFRSIVISSTGVASPALESSVIIT